MMLTALVCLVLGAAVAARLDPEPLTVGLIYSLHLCADCRWRNPLNRFRRESTARKMLFNTVRRLETKRSQWRLSADRCCGVRFMDWGWILLGVVVWVLCLLVVLVLLRMAGDQDRAARHAQKKPRPLCRHHDYAARSGVNLSRAAGLPGIASERF